MEQSVRRYSVYIHEFPNGKVYVGMTSQNSQNRWKYGHGYKHQPQVWQAIVEHGWKNIRHRIIESGLSKPEAEELERVLIKIHRANDPAYGYNIENGGTAAGKVSDVTRQKITGEGNPFYGQHLSEDHKEKIRDTRRERDIQPVNKRRILCVETGVIYESTAEATRQLGVHNFAIRRVCYGQRKTAGGYHWKYIDE